MGRKAYEKPRLIPLGKASELAKADIKHNNPEIPSRDKIIDDFILKIDIGEFKGKIKKSSKKPTKKKK